MATTFIILNHSRRECIRFEHINASTKREIAGNVIAASVVAWYMLECREDDVRFYSSEDVLVPAIDLDAYRDVTDETIDALVAAGIFSDEGKESIFDDEPDLYLRKLRNVWMADPRAHR